MQQAMRQFDRDMDSMFWGGRSPFLEAERQIDRALRRADEEMAGVQQGAPAQRQSEDESGGRNNVRVERSESRAPGSYRYYERIEISSGPGWGQQQPLAPLAAAASPPPLHLLAALVAAGAYAGLTAAFARNYDLTLYAARDKLRLALAWPLLLLTSRPFRAQFLTAVVRGERVRVTADRPSEAPLLPPPYLAGRPQQKGGGGADVGGGASESDGESRPARG